MPDINLVYRKSTTPTTNGATAFKGSPLTNDELDNNFYGINVEMLTKAPINNAVFTGSTTIPNIIASGGTINGTVIGGTVPVAGTFTTVTTTGNLTVGDATGDILSIRAGTALLPALTTAGDLNTGMWFPAADTIAWSTNGAERLRLTDTVTTITNNLTVTGDVAVNGGDLTTSATTFNLLDATATTLNLARAATAITLGATTGTTTVRNNISVTGTGFVGGATSIGGAATLSSTLAVTGATTLSSTLGVTGVSTLNSAVITNSATVGTTLGVTGAATLGSTLAVTGAATLSSTLAVTGNTTLNSNVTLAGSTTAATEFFRITDGAGTPVTKFLVDSANGNTTISGTLGVTGAATLSSTLGVTGATTLSSTLGVTGATTLSSTLGVTGASTLAAVGATSLTVSGTTSLAAMSATTGSFSGQVTSTVAVGTAPLVVTSTTKVANLNADRVDNITFTAPSATGSVPYVSAVSGTDYTVVFSAAGTANTILSSTGSTLEWVSPSGLSAGTSLAADHINSGNNGDLLYQYSVTVTVTTTTGSNVVSVPSVITSGILAGQIIVSNSNIPGGVKVVSINTGANTIIISENATATGAIATKFLSTSKLPIGTTGQVLTATSTAPTWSNNISISGTLAHTGLVPTAGTNIDQVYSATDAALVVTTAWVDTSVNATELAAGSYMVQVSTGAGPTLEFHTGVMSWFSGDANTASGDEIILHRASAGSDTSNLFLRVFRSATTTTDMLLQISASSARTAASYTYKFRRMI